MALPEHEHTLIVWTAGLLRELYGLDARQEQKQVGGGRIDVAGARPQSPLSSTGQALIRPSDL